MTNTAIEPFTVSVPQAELEDLAARLRNTRLPAALPGEDWNLGVPTHWLTDLVDYWREEYDWRSAEAQINRFPQFTTEIDGQRIHFLHVRSENPDAMPLLLTHGWPGSFVEFLDIIGPLTDPGAHGAAATDAFHVVIPAIPGFGFSSPLNTGGWSTRRIATAWDELMGRLGYDHYGTQGGDLGASISPEIGRVAPERVIGVHTNGGPGPFPPFPLSADELGSLTDVEQRRVAEIGSFMQEQFGYIAIQSTRPQTLAYGLTDSPVGQLAWIMDKFREWTFPREVLPEKIIDRDRLLTNVMIYWLTGTAGSAAFVGYAQAGGWGGPKAISGVPTGAIVFASDVGIRRYSETENTIVHWSDVADGGHFAALEKPAELVADVRAFFRSLR